VARSTVRIFHAQAVASGLFVGRRFVRKVSREIEEGAKLIASHGEYTTGRLAASIEASPPIVAGTTVSASIGSDLSYAAAVESGAKVHSIFPKRAPHIYRFGPYQKPMLKFYWKKAGRIAYFHQIPGGPGTIGLSHPGQKGKGYLIRPFGRAVIKYRMRVTVSVRNINI
jgi:hypothetical protein